MNIINMRILLILLGICISYLLRFNCKKIIKYPSCDNTDIVYKDDNNVCYKYYIDYLDEK